MRRAAPTCCWARAKEQRINLRFVDADHLGISFDQSIRRQELERLLTVFKTDAAGRHHARRHRQDADGGRSRRTSRRTSAYLTHPVFEMYHSETEMLRYLRHLQVKDVALDQSMIPLGSCTMKLNATTEMIPVTWRSFSMLHPFVPLEQAQGYHAALRGTRGHAGRDHRLRCRVAAAQCRQPGRICRAPGHPRLSRIARARASRRLPHPDLGAWHQSGLRRDGGHEGGGRRLRHERAMSTSPTSRPRPSSTATIWPR